jgi:hypothetical protein
MSVITALAEGRQGDGELKANLNYIRDLVSKNEEETNKPKLD